MCFFEKTIDVMFSGFLQVKIVVYVFEKNMQCNAMEGDKSQRDKNPRDKNQE